VEIFLLGQPRSRISETRLHRKAFASGVHLYMVIGLGT